MSFALLAAPALAQTKSVKQSPPLEEAAPSSAGVSADRLARIDAVCEDAVREGRIPGVVALVARNGKIVYYKAFGMADNQANRSLKRDDIFRIASQSKAITATAVMMLWEEGRFRLDDPISNWIPEFKNPQVLKTYNEADGTWTGEPAKREITIRDLLTHTSGLGYGVIDGDARFKKLYADAGVMDLFTTEPVTIGESVKRLAKLPLHHQPGEKYTYGEGLDVLGYLIEVVSGMPFDVFLQKRLFGPLGMKDSGFYLPAAKADRLVAVQKPEGGKWVRYPVTFYDPEYPIKGAKSFFSGGAGLCSTAKDYATFLQMYLNGGELGGVRILSRTTVETILAEQVARELWGGNDKYYGLAFGVVTEKGAAKGGEGSVGTFDWGGYFNTQYFADPKEKLIGVLMKQTQGGNDNTGWKFRQLVGQTVDD
ncbi:MAG TPA: serine hydrolase domain-containing protein [Verrucomicrobiota bacterium]|nr:serine hydrolase [Verrucomicrobiales bacterium]HRI14859.1 serine hydrolase domain-containing protein [Verrucomicrobiota bacterium]